MSYTGEAYNGRKTESGFVAPGVPLTLDNLIVQIKPGANSNKIQIKTVTGSIAIYGVVLWMQATVYTPVSAYGMTLSSGGFVDFFPANYFNETGCVQKIWFRTNLGANNQGVYCITGIAGTGSGPAGFDKFSLCIERL